jgi:hypothetical protein
VPYTICMSLFHRSREKIALIIDMSSGSVGAALVGFSEDRKRKPTIRYTTRIPVAFSKRASKEQTEKALLATLLEVMLAVESGGMARLKASAVHDAFIYFGSPWQVSAIRELQVAKQEAFVAHAGLFNELIEKEETQFNDSVTSVKNSGKKPKVWGDMKIEKIVLQSSANGYVGRKCEGRLVKECAATLLLNAGSTKVYDGAHDIVAGAFSPSRYNVCSSLEALLSLRSHTDGLEDEVLIKVTETTTDVYIFVKDNLRTVSTFPVGYDTLLRELSSITHDDLDVVLSRVKLYFNKESTAKEEAEIVKLLSQVESIWQEEFIASLKECAKTVLIPQSVSLMCSRSLFAKWFTEFVRRVDFSGVAFHESASVARTFSTDIFKNVLAFDAGVGKDVLLFSEALFAYRRLG